MATAPIQEARPLSGSRRTIRTLLFGVLAAELGAVAVLMLGPALGWTAALAVTLGIA